MALGQRPHLWRAALLVGAATLTLACAQRVGGIHARMGYSEAHGLRVVDVPARGPAHRAGLREGDRIVAVDGDPVDHLTIEQLLRHLRGPIGTEVELTVQRDDELIELEVARAPYR